MLPDTFSKQGYLIAERLFNPGLIGSVYQEYRRQYSSFDLCDLPPHLLVGNRRLQLPIQLRGPFLEPDLYANHLLLGILKMLFGTPFLIDSITCVTALSGAGDQSNHVDHPLLFAEHDGLAASLPPYAVTVAIPLIDLDPTTGTTRLFPGSSRTGGDRNGIKLSLTEEVCPFIRRGDCFLMDYRLWHGGMANLSERDRPILYITYTREWFTDVINFAAHSRMTVDIADVERIPAEHRTMFRRLAVGGLHDLSINELLAGP